MTQSNETKMADNSFIIAHLIGCTEQFWILKDKAVWHKRGPVEGQISANNKISNRPNSKRHLFFLQYTWLSISINGEFVLKT